MLQERCLECRATFSDKKSGFFALNDRCFNGHFLCNPSEVVNRKEYVEYAEDAWELFKQPKTYELEELREIFDTQLKKVGYASLQGTVKQSELKDDFIRFYGTDYLLQIGCEIEDSEGNWLFRMLRKNKSSQHPLKYILLS